MLLTKFKVPFPPGPCPLSLTPLWYLGSNAMPALWPHSHRCARPCIPSPSVPSLHDDGQYQTRCGSQTLPEAGGTAPVLCQ